MTKAEVAEAGIVHAPGRRATWFELFFDLVFVAAVAQLSSAFAAGYDLGGALRFVLAFLVLWWAWLGHTFHASRFDEDRPGQRALGMAAILAVVLIGYGAGDAFGARGWAFAAGLVAFKALLVVAYVRERRRPYARAASCAPTGPSTHCRPCSGPRRSRPPAPPGSDSGSPPSRSTS